MTSSNYSEEYLLDLEEKLLEKERRQDEMKVSGRSVFEIDRIKRKNREKEETSTN